ncbi:hypothetical protein DUI87_11090 [Hirundo rustica rustica]|uniref:Uncharacterized protein n=1 Tax=Hirundo rustica rustica TaxID=333673 RepID=A0A3M0KLX3_HIRRU|nr:hypothetical protein DUI87_11090 [Hirundo rustica rustica]
MLSSFLSLQSRRRDDLPANIFIDNTFGSPIDYCIFTAVSASEDTTASAPEVIGFALAAMSMDQADRDGDHDVSSWKGGNDASPPQQVDYKHPVQYGSGVEMITLSTPKPFKPLTSYDIRSNSCMI